MSNNFNQNNIFAKTPAMYVDESAQSSKIGFTPFAELWNGRLAMIGFAALLLIELFTGKGILGLLQ